MWQFVCFFVFFIGRSVAFIVAELSKADSVREETASRVPGHEKH